MGMRRRTVKTGSPTLSIKTSTGSGDAKPVGERRLFVDVARVAAISSVILLHSTAQPPPITMDADYVFKWWTWDIWSSVAWVGVPLFIMISGALLLRPDRVHEPMGNFFRKRWKRIGLPFIFWGAVYVVWNVIVNQKVVDTQFVLDSVLSGPYFQFWYLYMLIGLYFATPLLRVLITHMDRKMFKFFLVVWFIGTILQPVWGTIYAMNPNAVINLNYLFYFSGYLGCYLFGAFLRDVNPRRIIPVVLLAGSLAWSILGNYIVSGTFGMAYNYFIWGNLTANVIATATALFLILTRVRYTNPLFSLISQNTLSIYLFHVIIIESFEKGYFGFTLNSSILHIAAEFPLMTAVTLLVSLIIVAPLKKVPFLNSLF